jgi:hypothetical protein
MLQHSPPVGFSSRQQADQLPSFWNVMSQLNATLEATSAVETLQVLNAVLQQQIVRHVGTLVAWAQRQPEQLCKLPGLMAVWNATVPQGLSAGTAVVGVAGASWYNGLQLLDSMLVQARTLDSTRASSHRIIKSITEQLEQSGGR